MAQSKRLPPLESLRVLESCVRHGNFTQAATELGLTPAAVSLRIRDLEAKLGIVLFRRAGPRITPTPQGVALASRIGDALSIISAAVGSSSKIIAPIRVTAVPTLAARWLAPRLYRYHSVADAAPIELDVSAEMRPGSSFDVAIRTGGGEWSGFDASALFVVDATPMLSPKLAETTSLLSPENLKGLPLLPHHDWTRWFREVNVDPAGLRFYPGDYPSHELNAVAAMESAGVALLSPTFFEVLIQERKLVRPFQHLVQGPAWHYVVIKRGESRASVRHFCRWLLDEASATSALTNNMRFPGTET